MSSACLVGSTGIVGGHIYRLLSNNTQIKTIYAYSRRELPGSDKLKSLLSQDTEAWPKQYPNDADVFISGLGTSRAAAGGVKNQRKIDLNLNLSLAKAAKTAGTKTYILISSHGADSSSSFAYMKMKGELDDAVQALGFDHCIILRPGLIVGPRPSSSLKTRMHGFVGSIANVAGSVSGGALKNSWAQDADVIARAAVRAALDCLEGKETDRCRILGQSDIVRLGKTEWKDSRCSNIDPKNT